MHSLFYHPILFCRNLIFLLEILADFQARVDPLHLSQYFYSKLAHHSAVHA